MPGTLRRAAASLIALARQQAAQNGAAAIRGAILPAASTLANAWSIQTETYSAGSTLTWGSAISRVFASSSSSSSSSSSDDEEYMYGPSIIYPMSRVRTFERWVACNFLASFACFRKA